MSAPARLMALAKQTISLLDAARDIVRSLPADAVLLLTETDMDWNEVYGIGWVRSMPPATSSRSGPKASCPSSTSPT